MDAVAMAELPSSTSSFMPAFVNTFAAATFFGSQIPENGLRFQFLNAVIDYASYCFGAIPLRPDSRPLLQIQLKNVEIGRLMAFGLQESSCIRFLPNLDHRPLGYRALLHLTDRVQTLPTQ